MKNLAKEFIKKHEGFSEVEYLCPAEFRTIGYGRNLESNPLKEHERAFIVNGKISKEGAQTLLEREIESIYGWLSTQGFFPSLNKSRGAVLIDMIYNVGIARFLGFKRMISALKKGDYIGAGIEMRKSKWFHQVGNRARFLASVMEHGKIVK